VKEAILLWENYFFLEVFLDAGFTSFESLLFILAALFLWNMFFLAALSAKEIASFTFLIEGFLFACLIAISKRLTKTLLIASFLFETLSALLAVFVTGIVTFSASIIETIQYINSIWLIRLFLEAKKY